MRIFSTYSAQETKELAKKLAKELPAGVFLLTGGLGAGKTTFVQGFARGLGIKEKIISPTFILIRQYQIPNNTKILYHIDLYRLDKIHHLGLEEIWSDPNNIVLIEWAEKAKNILPKQTTWIGIEKDVNKRIITIS